MRAECGSSWVPECGSLLSTRLVYFSWALAQHRGRPVPAAGSRCPGLKIFWQEALLMTPNPLPLEGLCVFQGPIQMGPPLRQCPINNVPLPNMTKHLCELPCHICHLSQSALQGSQPTSGKQLEGTEFSSFFCQCPWPHLLPTRAYNSGCLIVTW